MLKFKRDNIVKTIVNNLKVRTKLLIVYFIIVAVTVLTVGIYQAVSLAHFHACEGVAIAQGFF